MSAQGDTLKTLPVQSDIEAMGREMHRWMEELYPICRSITGNGFRSTLDLLRRHIPITVHEVPTGTQVFDWNVPREWNIRDAYVKDRHGNKVIDFRKHSLHILNYSVPIRRSVSLTELQDHLFSLPEQPDLIPYRTSYYKEQWGFCVSENVRRTLTDDEYEVVIDSSLVEGSLTYGELVLPGEVSDEVLISCHSCHPSLCNDNLSGVVLSSMLATVLLSQTHRFTYRFLFIPGAIGSITWLSRNEDVVSNIQHGLVVACVGDSGSMAYKKSRQGNALIDRIVQLVLRDSGENHSVREFSPYGYDERQYCSPGFNLPVGSLTRTPHGEFPEYHTSADNLDFVRAEYLADSLRKYLSVIGVVEHNRIYRNLAPKCEPQLGKRGLYNSMGGLRNTPEFQLALLWVLNLSDGEHSLVDIAERSGMPFEVVYNAAEALRRHNLLAEHEQLHIVK